MKLDDKGELSDQLLGISVSKPGCVVGGLTMVLCKTGLLGGRTDTATLFFLEFFIGGKSVLRSLWCFWHELGWCYDGTKTS